MFCPLLMGCQPSASDSAVADADSEVDGQTISSLASLNYTSSVDTHHDEGGRVKVELSSAWSEDGLLVVRGIFTPDDAGFHLYDSKLPKIGISGLGRPTLMEVDDSDALQDIGPLVSDKKAFAHHDDTLDITLSIYPDGAVTLYLPLRFSPTPQAPTSVPIKLTYMACSEARCYSPIEGAVVEITAPTRN